MDMREALNAAIEETNTAEDLEETQQVVESYDEETSESEDDTEENKSGAVDAAEQSTSAEARNDAEADPDPTKESEKAPTDSLKAPAGWSPKERESWSKIPRNLQESIISREKAMADTMAGTKQARQIQDHFQRLSQSYAPVLAAEGVSHPMQAVESLFQTVSKLRMGTPQQKAQEAARIISAYGVDIQALDDALVGNPQPSRQQNGDPRIDSLLEQKLAPFNEFMQTVQQLQERQKTEGLQQAQNEVANFAATHEFLGDVREDMADIIDLAAKRGVQLTMEQAYDRACAAHPEISNVITQRKSDEALLSTRQTLDSKRSAASSLSGRQTGAGGRAGGMSLRDSLAAAFDEAAG